MESHIRIKITANRVALQQLECSQYKVLLCLAGHADKFGKSFPFPSTIAKEADLHIQTVRSALKTLITERYIKVLRKPFKDMFSGQSLPPVFQVSPFFLEIADKFLESALSFWNGGGSESISPHNQQQELPSLNNTNNQYQETTTTTKTTNRDSDEKPQTAKSEKQKTTAQPPNSAPQQKADVPPRQNKFSNPTGIAQPLPDALSEKLAERLNVWKIPMPLARGLIFKFGYENVDKAANYTEFCSKMQEIQTMAGFFRTTLETNTHDAELIDAVNHTGKDYTGGKYSDFVES